MLPIPVGPMGIPVSCTPLLYSQPCCHQVLRQQCHVVPIASAYSPESLRSSGGNHIIADTALCRNARSTYYTIDINNALVLKRSTIVVINVCFFI